VTKKCKTITVILTIINIPHIVNKSKNYFQYFNFSEKIKIDILKFLSFYLTSFILLKQPALSETKRNKVLSCEYLLIHLISVT